MAVLILGDCARCGAELPGDHHSQELPRIFVDEGQLVCADCGDFYSMLSHGCFLSQWIEERKRWPLPEIKAERDACRRQRLRDLETGR